MKYNTLYSVAESILDTVKATGLFPEKSMGIAAISNTQQLLSVIDTFNVLPGAVVCIGECTFENDGLVRDKDIIIAVADSFKASTNAKAHGIWAIVDSVCAMFILKVEPGTVPQRCIINGVEFTLKGFTPIPSKSNIVAFAITLSAVEAASYEIEE